MSRFALLILICLIIWGFWMTWEWLRNRNNTPIIPTPEKEEEEINNTKTEE